MAPPTLIALASCKRTPDPNRKSSLIQVNALVEQALEEASDTLLVRRSVEELK